MSPIPSIKIRETISQFRVSCGIEFTDVIKEKLEFLIPITDPDIVRTYPDIFQLARAEYSDTLNVWLGHQLLSHTSAMAVMNLDAMWQNILKRVGFVNIFWDEHDESSKARIRPDFTAMSATKVLVMKGEAKAKLSYIVDSSSDDLIVKFHPTVHKLFPNGCNSIPAVSTCGEALDLYAIQYFNKVFTKKFIQRYTLDELSGRIEFTVTLFNILRWIMSQTNPIEAFHLLPEVRTKTRNGHHVTLIESGLLKEFDKSKLNSISLDIIGKIYKLRLPNVEYGTVNHISITITRVGSKLKDIIRMHSRNKNEIYQQVEMGIEQLHANGFAHCDICLDNIFVDSLENGGNIFIGDLEYCRLISDAPPVDIRRADRRARTAGDLDNFQLENFKDELARIC